MTANDLVSEARAIVSGESQSAATKAHLEALLSLIDATIAGYEERGQVIESMLLGLSEVVRPKPQRH